MKVWKGYGCYGPHISPAEQARREFKYWFLNVRRTDYRRHGVLRAAWYAAGRAVKQWWFARHQRRARRQEV